MEKIILTITSILTVIVVSCILGNLVDKDIKRRYPDDENLDPKNKGIF